MKLEALRILRRQISRDLSVKTIEQKIFYFYKSKWYELDSELPCSDAESRDLDKSKRESVAHQKTNSNISWFYLKNIDATIWLKFSQSPQTATRKRVRDQILKIQKDAENSYKVSHNQLTHLLARESFRDILSGHINSYNERNSEIIETQEAESARLIAVLALDIDHFKQVNDTWGHLYGDQVLKTFARRLENCAVSIMDRGMGDPKVHIGHPSGEEFLVVIEANAVRDKFVEWANDFCGAISVETLPNDTEWLWLSGLNDNSIGSSPPPLHERVVTASVGIAFYGGAPIQQKSSICVSELLDRADTALYRAKASGRNQTISYDDILSNHGRVIEHDVNAGVVALDIGSNVGVELGQEFMVFLPTYTGQSKFHVSDGRTKRALGFYPRVESARVVVFDSQPELAFAYIANADFKPVLEPGSHLEAIPAGSIGHLLPSSSRYFSASSKAKDRDGIHQLQQFLRDATEKNPFAIIVRFSKGAECLRKYGSVALNSSLAQLYREAQKFYPVAKAVEVIDRDSICIVGENSTYNEATLSSFVSSMASSLREFGVVSGVFCASDVLESNVEGQEQLRSENAFEFARFAASDRGRDEASRIRHFNYSVACSVIQSLRDENAFEVGYADYTLLSSLGLKSARLFNLGGLISGGIGKTAEELECFASAINLSPATLIYKSNYGTAAYKTGEVDSGLKVLNAISLGEIDRLVDLHSFGLYRYLCLLAKAYLSNSLEFNKDRFLYAVQFMEALTKYENTSGTREVRVVIERIKME